MSVSSQPSHGPVADRTSCLVLNQCASTWLTLWGNPGDLLHLHDETTQIGIYTSVRRGDYHPGQVGVLQNLEQLVRELARRLDVGDQRRDGDRRELAPLREAVRFLPATSLYTPRPPLRRSIG
jgi:hypothetical protein